MTGLSWLRKPSSALCFLEEVMVTELSWAETFRVVIPEPLWQFKATCSLETLSIRSLLIVGNEIGSSKA